MEFIHANLLKMGKPIWVAWSDNEQEKQITISGITSERSKNHRGNRRNTNLAKR